MAKAANKGFELDAAAVSEKLQALIGDTIAKWLESANSVDPEVEKKKEQLKALLDGDALEQALASLPDSTDNVEEAKEVIGLGLVTLANKLKLPVAYKDAAAEQKKINDIGRSVLKALQGAGVDLESLSVPAANMVRHTIKSDSSESSDSGKKRMPRGSMPKEADAETIALIKKTISNGQAWKKADIKAAIEKAGTEIDKIMAKKIDLAVAELVEKKQLVTDGERAGMTYSKAWK